ncbi:DUF1672 family protein [Metabacillus iocasae]|uniref:DUF1672 domain-containing protein n=1 Tax=Priestia iocasae TaxID=2291674 RepID=A0ABS2QTS2_9BACI|nr:DUF1672 family protein [Metabacillus iocasae]MBM7702327.1 hypothetical protein [Metabacillus iocasae]
MKINSKTLLCSLGISLMLGGCSDMNRTNNTQGDEKGKETQAASSEDTMASVQDYTGEGYALPYGKETDKIANENLDQIEKAAIKLFKENYKTDVTVHNVVGAKDGATVFVESVGEPHFYTHAVVPIDEKKVSVNEIWVDDYQVQNAIKGGLYHMLFQEEFQQLDKYFESLTEEGQVTGKTKEALQNVGGHGFMTPYYLISTSKNDEAIKPVYELYISNPDESIQKLRSAFNDSEFSAEDLTIGIQLFMKDKEEKPSEEIFNQVVTDLEKMTNIPRGAYGLVLNDNLIHRETSEGFKENSLERDYPNQIIKE